MRGWRRRTSSPRLRQAGHLVDTVTVLLVQHARGRAVTADILTATVPDGRVTDAGRALLEEAMAAFVRMYEVHEAREDTVVFPAFRAGAPDRAFAELGERFAEEQDRQFGAHGFADMVDRVAAIEQALGIYELDQFTPSAG